MRSRAAARLCLIFVLCVLMVPATVTAEVVVLQADKDNTIYEPDGNLSNGAGSYLFAGHTNQNPPRKRRGLIAFRFDQAGAAIPPGSTITAVTLTMRMSRTKAGTVPVSLHRALAAWGEGTSNADNQEGQGAPATSGDATWTYRFFNTLTWRTPGGEFSPTASATTQVGGNGPYTFSGAGLLADVQLWVNDPASNFGWFVVGFESGAQTAKRFDSSENGTLANRPTLSVTYSPPVVTGACCIAGSCSVRTSSDCLAAGGTDQGNGTSCTPNPCALPTGACCAADGACTLLSGSACSGSGGTYRGDGTTCTPNPCPQPTGACCANDGTCSDRTESECAAAGGHYEGTGSTCSGRECPVILTPFVDPLPLPAPAQPVSGSIGGAATYRIAMTEIRQKLHRDLPATTVWGFGGGYPGPTIEARTGLPVEVTWVNDLRDAQGFLRTEHYLPVDTCLMGPDTAGAAPRTVVHLHGGHVPAAVDGYPEHTFLPGEQVNYVYPNLQQAGTLWYHDHALGITRLNVIMGLAGFYLLRDDVEDALGLPSGEYEVPLAIQDRTFRADGSLVYPAAWQEHFFGDTLLVNGKVWPFHNVKRGKYRFRLLNGSTSRTYTLRLSQPGMPFTLIGNEGGLLPAPVLLEEITMVPGERYDVIVDFAGLAPGTEVVLTNSAPIMFPGTPGEGVIPNVMKLVVTNQGGFTGPIPSALRPVERLLESQANAVRQFDLRKGPNPCTGSMWLINGLGWHDVTEYPPLDTTEVWSFVNNSGVTHPMHMHLVMFQLLDRQPFDLVDGQVVPAGPRVPAPPGQAGWKDTVACNPGEITRVIARFERYTGRYAYHCHIIEHEDNEMMRQFQTIACGNADLEPTEECEDGNTADFDLCSAACRRTERLVLGGAAQGGTVAVVIAGVTVVVTTPAGATVADVLAALAAAINADPALRALRITATVTADGLLVGGRIADVRIADAGLRERLDLAVRNDLLFWSSASANTGYDAVQGDIRTLLAFGGDFSRATSACLANDQIATQHPFTSAPPAGEAWWFLVRKVGAGGPGTYDTGEPSQVGSRDAEIAASPNRCP